MLRLLQLAGKGKWTSADEFESFFAEPGGTQERELLLMAVRAIAADFDAACGAKRLKPILPEVRSKSRKAIGISKIYDVR